MFWCTGVITHYDPSLSSPPTFSVVLDRATKDDHYLQVGKTVLKALQQYARVTCGYAAVNDVRTRHHEDRMDSFVLSETVKYLYMLFSEDSELPLRLENYVLTTEAYFLPLSLATAGKNATYFSMKIDDDDEDKLRKTCPNTASLVAAKVRQPMRKLLVASAARPAARLRPINDPRQVHALSDMGISVLTLPDGRVQLLYTTTTAKTAKDAAEGLTFMREMSRWNSMSDVENGVVACGVQFDDNLLPAGPAHFGAELVGETRFTGTVTRVTPEDACTPITNKEEIDGEFGLAVRGQCTFAQKVRNIQAAGARLAIITDNVADSSHESTAMFAMSGDGKDDITIPAVFLFAKEGTALTNRLKLDPEQRLIVGELSSMRKELLAENADADTGVVLPPPVEKDSFDHLKKVLGQLVSQFELSLADGAINTWPENVARSERDATEICPVQRINEAVQPESIDAGDKKDGV